MNEAERFALVLEVAQGVQPLFITSEFSTRWLINITRDHIEQADTQYLPMVPAGEFEFAQLGILVEELLRNGCSDLSRWSMFHENKIPSLNDLLQQLWDNRQDLRSRLARLRIWDDELPDDLRFWQFANAYIGNPNSRMTAHLAYNQAGVGDDDIFDEDGVPRYTFETLPDRFTMAYHEVRMEQEAKKRRSQYKSKRKRPKMTPKERLERRRLQQRARRKADKE